MAPHMSLNLNARHKQKLQCTFYFVRKVQRRQYMCIKLGSIKNNLTQKDSIVTSNRNEALPKWSHTRCRIKIAVKYCETYSSNISEFWVNPALIETISHHVTPFCLFSSVVHKKNFENRRNTKQLWHVPGCFLRGASRNCNKMSGWFRWLCFTDHVHDVVVAFRAHEGTLRVMKCQKTITLIGWWNSIC